MDFTEPYENAGLQFVVRKDENLTSVDQLKGKKIAVEQGLGHDWGYWEVTWGKDGLSSGACYCYCHSCAGWLYVACRASMSWGRMLS